MWGGPPTGETAGNRQRGGVKGDAGAGTAVPARRARAQISLAGQSSSRAPITAVCRV